MRAVVAVVVAPVAAVPVSADIVPVSVVVSPLQASRRARQGAK
jgi:hypothetical protein